MFGDITAHNCYGAGGEECQKYWGDSKNGSAQTKPVSEYKKQCGDRMIVRNFFPIFYLIISLIVGCAKPFQPPPVAVEAWIKSGAERQEVLRQLLDCGYPDAVGFVGINGRDVKRLLIDSGRSSACLVKDLNTKVDGEELVPFEVIIYRLPVRS